METDTLRVNSAYVNKSPISKVIQVAVSLTLVTGAGVLAAAQSNAAPATPKPAASTTAKTITNPTATPIATNAPGAFSIALIGDMPYDALGVQQVPNVINAINNSNVAFTLFDGDTMSGKGDKCTDEAYPNLKTNFFDKFKNQIFYSVGDNEWVDCDRPVKGAYDPNSRLALVRQNFFGNAANYVKLGQKALTGPGTTTPVKIDHDPNYPEMQMFTYNGITVIIPNIPGSANNSPTDGTACKTYNDLAKDGDAAEYAARDAANVAWINKGFEKAKADNANGVIVVVQANMDWEGYLAAVAMPDKECTAAYNADKQALLTNALSFIKPVLLQNGDEHWYQLDMPMNETAGKLVQKDKGALVANFTRVQTFGSGFNHWVELGVDPTKPGLWTFTPHIISGNLTAH